MFSNYERQVEAQLPGTRHVAWNSPLAWLETERVAAASAGAREAIACATRDRDLTSHHPRAGRRRYRRARRSARQERRGRRARFAAGDADSADYLADHGLKPDGDFEVERVRRARRQARRSHRRRARCGARAARGEVDAACIIDANHLAFAREGTIPPARDQDPRADAAYDHCNFTVLDDAPPEQVAQFRELLLAMSYADAEVRPLLDLEGLKQWVPGRVSGYAQLAAAVDRFGTIDAFVSEREVQCR